MLDFIFLIQPPVAPVYIYNINDGTIGNIDLIIDNIDLIINHQKQLMLNLINLFYLYSD